MTDEKVAEKEGVGTKVGVENGKVLIMFSERLTVVGYSPKDAKTLAKALKKHAIAAENMARGNGT